MPKTPLRYFIIQSTLAFVFMLVLLLIVHRTGGFIVVASFASTAFLVFARPNSHAARARSVIGGHWLSMLVGGVCVMVMTYLLQNTFEAEIIMGALAVGLAMFVMTVTDTEHAPAAGTALAMILNRADILKVAAAVVVGSLFLSGVWWLAKGRLRDLT